MSNSPAIQESGVVSLMGADGGSTLPDVNSFMELPGTQSRQSSASAQSVIEQSFIGPVSWKLGLGPSSRQTSIATIDPRFDIDNSATVHSDTHPDVVATLISEYIADTILRIDAGALVDVSTVIKQDLIVVTGEVGCSHPAKSGIVHSDQFLGTLNASIRELLKEIGFDTPQAPNTNTTIPVPPAAAQSPMRKPAVPAPSTPGPTGTSAPSSPPEDPSKDDIMDPAHAHIIVALTDPGANRGMTEHTCMVRARASNSDMTALARQICNRFTQHFKASRPLLAGGVSVHVIPGKDRHAQKVLISFHCPSFTEELLSDVADNCLSTEFVKSLGQSINDQTVIELHNSSRHRMTGRSYTFSGKDWRDPRRYGHVLVMQEAMNAVKSGACSSCEVALGLSRTGSVSESVVPTLIHVHTIPDSKTADKSLGEKIASRINSLEVNRIKESVITEENPSFYGSDRGGSTVSHESIGLRI